MINIIIKYKYYIALIIVIIICTIVYFTRFSEKFSGTSSSIKKTTNSVKYFGGNYCPHSRIGSRAHTLIKEFEKKYPDIRVEYYWTGEDNEEFTKANAQYVPTITDSRYRNIVLSLPQGIDTSQKTDDELKELVLINVRNQL
jgi:hypothetical protein